MFAHLCGGSCSLGNLIVGQSNPGTMKSSKMIIPGRIQSTKCNRNSITMCTSAMVLLTFVESSCIFVCSAMKRTQKQLLWTRGGHRECENAGLSIIGLLIPDGPISPKSGTPTPGKSSDADWGIGGIGPWIWQLPPNGPVPVKLSERLEKSRKKRFNSTRNIENEIILNLLVLNGGDMKMGLSLRQGKTILDAGNRWGKN